MAHMPSGDFNANATWPALTALAHNLTRALATLADHGLHHATTKTIRRTPIAVPARRLRHAPSTLRLPEHQPRHRAVTGAAGASTPSRCSTESTSLTANDPRNPRTSRHTGRTNTSRTARATTNSNQDQDRIIGIQPVNPGGARA